MASERFYLPSPMAFGSNGISVPGALANFYLTGGTTRASIYSDTGLTTEHTNPVVADGAGRFPVIYLDDAVTYRLVVTDADGGSLGVDDDPYIAPATTSDLAVYVTDAQTAQTAAETAQTAAETAKTGAETAQTAAETAQTAAELAETNAETAETNAEAAEAAAVVAAASAGNVYHDTTIAAATTTAEAALTTNDEFFVFGDDADYLGIRQMDSASTSIELGQLALSNSANTASITASYNAHIASLGPSNKPEALVVLATGQSTKAARGTAISTDIVAPPNCYMPVGGDCAAEMDFYASNNDYSVDWPEMASFAAYAVGTGETTQSGMLSLLAPHYGRIYTFSDAVGARSFLDMLTRGLNHNAHAYIQRACEDAHSNGFRPIGAILLGNGEADASAGNSEATVEERGRIACMKRQLMFAQHMGEPDYVAPVLVSRPTQMSQGTDGADARAILRAFDTLENEIPNFQTRSKYGYEYETDRTHPEEVGYRQDGETDALELIDFFKHGIRRKGFTAIAKWDEGTVNARLIFSEMAEDLFASGADFGSGSTNISSSGQWKGFQWFDNGTQITINSGTLKGNFADVVLNSIPAGTLAQQKVRQASQTTTVAVTSGSSNQVGSPLAAKDNRERPTIVEYGDATFGNNRRYLVSTELDVETM